MGCSIYSLWLIPAVHWLLLLTWPKWAAGCQGRFLSYIFITLAFWRIWLQCVTDGHNSLPNSSHRVLLLISYKSLAQRSMCCSHWSFRDLTYTAFSSLCFPKCFPNPHCLGLIWKDTSWLKSPFTGKGRKPSPFCSGCGNLTLKAVPGLSQPVKPPTQL